MTAAYSYHETLVKLDNVGLSFGDKVILRDINAEIRNIRRPHMQQGQVVAMLGPSGIGKTQLLHLIAGLSTPTSGHVLVPVGDKGGMFPVERGEVGVVFQDYPLFEHRTVYDNLRLAARDTESHMLEHRIDDMMRRFGLTEAQWRYPAQLSGGQRQRVAIAQQMLCSEHFLLMDEPFSGLDVVAEANVIQTILDVTTAHELNTVIVVTHDVTAAVAIADHIWLLGREPGKPGATIVENYDLIERNICWEIDEDREAPAKLVLEIKDRFHKL